MLIILCLAMRRQVALGLFKVFTTRQVISCHFVPSALPVSSSSNFLIKYFSSTFQLFTNQVSLSTDLSKLDTVKMQHPKLSEVVTVLKKLAPLEHAAEWDNVGLLIEPTGDLPVKTILLTNDLTEKVLNEAIDEKANLIVSYHPPLFRPFKRLTQRSWKERVAVRCIEHGIALYSPHTALDAIRGGINDWLLAPFSTTSTRPIEHSRIASRHFALLGYDYSMRVSFSPSLQQVELLSMKFAHLTSANFLLKQEDEHNYHIFCNKDILPFIIDTLNLTDGVTIKALTSNEAIPLLNEGSGRIATLSQPMSIEKIIETVKKHLELPNLRCALGNSHTRDTLVNSIAVCAGSGASVLRDVTADLVITGEMSHHEVLDMVNGNTSVILSEHSNSERGYFKHLQKSLANQLQTTQVLVSKSDSDPLTIV